MDSNRFSIRRAYGLNYEAIRVRHGYMICFARSIDSRLLRGISLGIGNPNAAASEEGKLVQIRV